MSCFIHVYVIIILPEHATCEVFVAEPQKKYADDNYVSFKSICRQPLSCRSASPKQKTII